ncbi:MAG: hypothetical protein AAF909_00920 [Pseudomonadota bacterium]
MLIREFIWALIRGFIVSALFLTLIFGLDLAGLRTLVMNSDVGGMAIALLFFMNGLTFSAGQVAFRMMSDNSEQESDGPGGLTTGVSTPHRSLVSAPAQAARAAVRDASHAAKAAGRRAAAVKSASAAHQPL